VGKNPPGFELGVKEVWELSETRLQPGEVIHTLGYPLKSDAFGGGFVYGMKDNLISVGQLTSLDYSDPFVDPHREFQKFKLHPVVSEILKGGKLVQYGAKTAPVGGYYSIPKVVFPGGLIIGDAASLFNGQKIKGIDLAMRSGMLAARTYSKACWPTASLRRDSWGTPRPWLRPRDHGPLQGAQLPSGHDQGSLPGHVHGRYAVSARRGTS
jgi:electron-transferring-flavoprotein dehydrogenase